jgi:hypothetical protein
MPGAVPESNARPIGDGASMPPSARSKQIDDSAKPSPHAVIGPGRDRPYAWSMTGLLRRETAHRAKRAQLVARFVTAAKADRSEVEQWFARWEEHAAHVGVAPDSPTYWSTGLRWIAAWRDAVVVSEVA